MRRLYFGNALLEVIMYILERSLQTWLYASKNCVCNMKLILSTQVVSGHSHRFDDNMLLCSSINYTGNIKTALLTLSS